MIAERMSSVDMSGIRKMFEMAGKDAINFGIGEPDFQPPTFVIDAYEKALRGGENNYGPSAGIPELRRAIADKEKDRWRDITPESVIVTCGSTSALYGTMAAFVNPGEEVLIPDPGFVLYDPHVRLVNGRPVPYPLRKEKGYVPQIEDLAALVTDRTKALIVNSPSNPTGATIPRDDVRRIADFANEHGLLLVSDEAYDTINYDQQHATFLGEYENVVYLNTFSKTYAMTGWRIGYAIAKPAFADALKKMNYHLVACPPTPTQWACLAALKGPQDFVKEMVTTFRERRDLISKLIKDVPGFDIVVPKGAFYAFPSYEFDMDCKELAMEILQRGKVVCTPGDAFGKRGKGHLRFSYATSTDDIRRGLAAVKDVVGQIRAERGI
jgi:aspartate aminotransferase